MVLVCLGIIRWGSETSVPYGPLWRPYMSGVAIKHGKNLVILGQCICVAWYVLLGFFSVCNWKYHVLDFGMLKSNMKLKCTVVIWLVGLTVSKYPNTSEWLIISQAFILEPLVPSGTFMYLTRQLPALGPGRGVWNALCTEWGRGWRLSPPSLHPRHNNIFHHEIIRFSTGKMVICPRCYFDTPISMAKRKRDNQEPIASAPLSLAAPVP
jgi:hypothetical protein